MSWRGRRGRPRKADAKRRKTTTAERRPETDLGSPQLLIRKIRVANGSAAPVELTDIAGILCAHELIEPAELVIARLLAGWLHQLRVAFGLPAASPASLWKALIAGQRAGRGMASGTGRTAGDAALFRLIGLHQHFAALHQLDRLSLTLRVASGEGWPDGVADLHELRAGLQTVAELQRRGRRAQIEAHPAG